MKIVSYRGPQHDLPEWHVNAPIDPAKITTLGGDIVIGLITATIEWRVTFDRRDVGVLGAALSRLTGSGP